MRTTTSAYADVSDVALTAAPKLTRTHAPPPGAFSALT
jgi:hypothetical protein